MKMTQFANFANDATKQVLGVTGLQLENLQSMFSYPDAIDVLNPVTVNGNIISIDDSAPIYAKRLLINIDSPSTGGKLVRCGKNMAQFPTLDATSRYGVNAQITSDGKLKIYGTATNNASTFYNSSKLEDYDSMPLGEFPAGTYSIIARGFIGSVVDDRITATVKTKSGTSIINTRISGDGVNADNGTGRKITFTSNEPFKIFLWVYIKSGSVINSTVELQLEYGETLGSWEPYTHIEINYDWESIAGTITNGVLDVLNGILTSGNNKYNLTPHNILMLNGDNTLYSDVGSIELEYNRKSKGGYMNG